MPHTLKPMYIYISGPYSASPNESASTKQQTIDANISRADEIAIEIAKKGHFPFVPHTMMRGWEDMEKVERSRALNICKKWVEKCDALYFIGESEGAEIERQLAVCLSLPVYRDLRDIPDATLESCNPKLSRGAVNAYLVEYQQCMESYRHTYATIWQAGSIFAAASAALIAFSSKSDGALPWWIQLLAPMPIIFWWWGIFWPMNRYGEWRSNRLKTIEGLLSEGGAASDLHMEHFRHFDRARKGDAQEGESLKSRAFRIYKGRFKTLKFIRAPRVSEIVFLFGLAIVLLELYLTMKNWPKLAAWLSSL